MSTTAEAMVNILTNNSGVAALIAARVYAMVTPQDAAMPAISYQRISEEPQNSHQGYSYLARTRYQLTCEADTYAAAYGLSVAVLRALEGYKGTVLGRRIDGIHIENASDGYGDVVPAPVVRMDAIVWHDEQ